MKKKNFWKIVLIAVLVFIVAVVGIGYGFIHSLLYPKPLVSGSGSTKVICVGDSITYGQGVIGSRDTDTYTALLAEMLGEDYQVVNYGLCNRTLLTTGNMPYINEDFAAESLTEAADIVIIMLGSNDSKPDYWNADLYEKEYIELVQKYQNMESAPSVYVMAPPCIFAEPENSGDCNNTVLTEEVIPAIKIVAEKTGAQLIDLYTVTEARSDLYSDGLHPNADGNKVIAEEIHEQLTAE